MITQQQISIVVLLALPWMGSVQGTVRNPFLGTAHAVLPQSPETTPKDPKSTEAVETPKAVEAPEFNRDVRPILSKHCIACHGPDEGDRQAGLRIDTFAGATEDLGGYAAIVPGKPSESELIVRLETDDEDLRMPPVDHANALEPDEIETLKAWVQSGAAYQAHWSFVAPKSDGVVLHTHQQQANKIDELVEQKRASAGLNANPSANPRSIVRRLSLDLTGLPPVSHSDDVQMAIGDYLKSPHQKTLGKLADRLMDSPAYAEHWASMWLDLARYADTVGYAGDETRDIWPWRDWLIQALMQNKSYRELSIEMLAGDMLPEATQDQVLATAFHRNTLSNNEGGTNDEEFRTIAIKDRLSTTLNAWMGLTVRCAECHSHKYDPISQQEYYQLLAFFNQTVDSDKRDDRPKQAIIPRRDERVAAELERKILDAQLRVADEPSVWTPIGPLEMKSQSGTTFELLDDLSVLAGGPNPNIETYEMTFELAPGQTIRAFRLEAIPHAKYDHKVGRSAEGAFILSQIRVVRHDADGDTVLKWKDAENDFNQPNQHAKTAIKEDVKSKAPRQGWAVRHPVDGYKRKSEAIFELAEPLVADGAADDVTDGVTDGAADDVNDGAADDKAVRYTISLRHDPPWPRLNLGCFRIAVCGQEDPVKKYRNGSLEPARRKLQQLMAEKGKQIRVPVLQELPQNKQRETFVMLRGNFQSPGEKVAASFPKAFQTQSDPKAQRLDRLGLAQWIFDPKNPLTARVGVNRYWARMMGMGIVETEEDFGTQGSPPSHPELLDYLSVQFRKSNWDVRGLLKSIVLSKTYQQSQTVSEDALRIDPRNRLYSRGPRVRLSAEVVRDQALAVAGLLSDKRFGPPVYPPSPVKRVVNAFTGGSTWKESQGEDRYRRALYTFLKRSAPHPLFETFDMASRDVCSMRRLRTNTPLQSFMTLNDTSFIEAARSLASSMLKHKPTSDDGQQTIEAAIEFGIQQALFSETVEETQKKVLTRLYHRCFEQYQQSAQKAAELTGADVKIEKMNEDQKTQLAQHAAMTVVANVIMNLDGFLNN